MNWYLEIALRNGTAKWDVMKETFLLTFSFEDGFECIDEALQEIKAEIFRMPKEPTAWVQLDWSTQLHHALECYNVTMEEGEEDPKNNSILESEGLREVEGPKVEVSDITKPLKTSK